MASGVADDGAHPVGQAWLRRKLALAVPPPAVQSFAVAGARRTEVHGAQTLEFYPRPYATEPTPIANLRFALRHEPIDLGVLVATLKAIDPAELEAAVRSEPTGAFSRRLWFLYETFTGKQLQLDDARAGNYFDALDPEKHVVAPSRRSPRHRISDNLLGGRGLCPTVRRTKRLTQQSSLHIDHRARALIESYDAVTLARAVNYLYTKETRSSFAIEGENPNATRTERFTAALRQAPSFDPTDKNALIGLQNAIVDPRYAAKDWRNDQTFVGETIGGYREQVHFICPRPEDVADLMQAWSALTHRVVDSGIDAVIAAAVCSFAFVLIHPFDDGNGRIHRFLLHHVLAKRDYSPAGVIFPVSAAILRDRRSYDQVLETFSRPLAEFIEWHWTAHQEIIVDNETADLYRYFDATAFAEYLYDRVADTVQRDLKEELEFVDVFDRALNAVREIVDMPDRRASLLVRLTMQNDGRLSRAKRPEFEELTDSEVAALEAAIQRAMQART
ncbi:MAG: Fic family protein [Burkholderiaceae bacterium]